MSDPVGIVRPFVMTGGRTRAERRDLRVETVLTAVPGARTGDLTTEQRLLVERCRAGCSIAELSAELGLLVGVTMILAGDLVADGRLDVHQTDPVEIQLDVLHRLIDKVRTL